jgi:hypothetical protein
MELGGYNFHSQDLKLKIPPLHHLKSRPGDIHVYPPINLAYRFISLLRACLTKLGIESHKQFLFCQKPFLSIKVSLRYFPIDN